mgnify:CR=1 FL=1
MNLTSRQEAIQQAQRWLKQNPLFLDTETSGMDKQDTVVEISLVDHQGMIMMDTLVHTPRPIARDAFQVHGITSEMTRQAPAWPEIWPELENLLTSAPVGIYNVEFDLNMIQQTNRMNWIHWSPGPEVKFFDVMKIYAQFAGERNPRTGDYRWVSLEKAGKDCGVPLPNTHRAKDDALLTGALLRKIARS